jgi:hypothetical protein
MHSAEPVVPPKNSRCNKRRFILLSVLLLIVSLVGVTIYVSLASDRRLRLAIEETDRRDPGWRLEEIVKSLPVLSDPENGALLRIEVQKKIPANWYAALPRLEALEGDRPERQLDSDLTARLRARLAEMSAVVEAARKLVLRRKQAMPRHIHRSRG